MANERRVHKDYFFGQLSAQATISDVTMSSLAFAALGTTFSTTHYMPVVLHNPAIPTFEVVWITGHSAASNNVTVVRAKEGTTAQAWPAGTQVLNAATVRDLLGVGTLAGVPADAHLGMRWLAQDLGTAGAVVEKTPSGWLASVGLALPSQVGPIHGGSTNPPDDATIVSRVGYINGTLADGSGGISVTYRQPFPTATIGVVVNSGTFGAVGPFVLSVVSASGFTVRAHNGTVAVPVSTPIFASYHAVGY